MAENTRMAEPASRSHAESDADDADLVDRASLGDEDAFRVIYRRYARPVYWIAHGILGSAPDAEDVVQETFVVAWRKLPSLTLAGESLLPWLATICRFQAANRLRRQRRDRAHTAEGIEETIPDTVDVEAQVIATALAERITAELGTLSALDREIFLLCASEGYGYQAAADELGVAHGTVRNRLSRVRTQLRARLGETEQS